MSPGPQVKYSRSTSFALVALAYVAGLIAAWLVVGWIGNDRPVKAAIVADFVATLVVWGFSVALRNGSVYDPYWTVVPPVLVLYWTAVAAPGAVALRQVLVALIVFGWAIRLTANWARGWPGLHHEDWRYGVLYAEWKVPKWVTSLIGIHVFPTVQVILGCLPLIPALLYGTHPVGRVDLLACLVGVGAILVELVADEQLRAFNRTKQPGDIIDTGLWKYSRHPNYFGELSFWFSLYLFGLAADPTYWWTVVGFVAMLAMFLFASIPMLDRRSVERRPAYAEHMKKVSALVPWFRRT